MKKYIKVILILLFLGVCFECFWFAFLTEIVPREYTFFLSYEHFCKKAHNYFLNETKPDSADNLKYYWYNGYFNKLRGIRMTLSQEDYEKEKEYYMNWCLERNSVVVSGVETYVYNAADIKYVDGEELKEKGLEFIDSLIDLDQYAYYYIVMEDNYTNKSDGRDIVSGRGVLANDEIGELLIYSYQLVNDSEQKENEPIREEQR